MEYPGPGKDDLKIYWSTSASVRENQPFLVSYFDRSSQHGSPQGISLYHSFYTDQPVIKTEEISCKVNVNPQVQSPDIMSLPSPVSENTNGMQQSLGVLEVDPKPLNCIMNESACTSASISSTELLTAKQLGCYPSCSDTLHCYTTSTRQKKPNILKRVVSCFDPFPSTDLVAGGACKSRLRSKKS